MLCSMNMILYFDKSVFYKILKTNESGIKKYNEYPRHI